ncbi:testis-specific protein TEX28 isoform X2 [Dasypus novemcinctus]|uniref:testis-specific protein TEX28 isoform X2 n=1 Tax=Dasypus novemcinctus TaxID=9361 RepID=UPI00062A8DEB|nr:testis-specific protein TEX28 isoform X2 [Dasypus novemcinctus]
MALQADHAKGQSATLPFNVPSCRSLASSEDGPSGHSCVSDGELARNHQESVKHRILYLSEQLRVEKASRDENTVGYLKLVSKANRHQAPHIRQAFERVNQRTSATIAQIERRLRQYHQQLRELEEGCQPKGFAPKSERSLHDCELPSREGPLASAPKPQGEDSLSADLSHAVRHFTLEPCSSGELQGKTSDMTQEAQQRHLLLQKMKEELEEAKAIHISLQGSYWSLKEQYLSDLQLWLESLEEGKCRQKAMEEQVTDHLQGYLDEIYHLKQNLACAEEKMAYLSYEHTKEIWEVMETFKSQIAKLETLQQVSQLEMMRKLRHGPQELLFKFMSLLLTLATILLVSVSIVCACPLPLIKTRLRTCATLMLIGLGALAWQRWPAISTVDWQAWVTSKWRLYSKVFSPLADGT